MFVFQQWYTATMNLLGTWLTERMDQQLHVYQLKILIRITKVGEAKTPHNHWASCKNLFVFISSICVWFVVLP